MAIRNVWSLNIDEALAVDKIKRSLSKDYEVFLPANGQLKNIDLILFDFKKRRSKTLQVKGSRTYDPRPIDMNRYGNGSAAWITITKKAIFQPTIKVDYYIFVLHSFVTGTTRKDIKIDYLIIPDLKLKSLAKQKKIRKGGKYHLYIWIDSQGKRSFEFRTSGKNTFNLSKYLNNWSVLKK